MTARPGPVLVIGSTGRQGGAVARRLLADGWQVRGLTRDPARPAAQALAALGIEPVRGDLDDPGSIRRAMQGAYGVFSVQDFWEVGLEREIRQGCAVADAAVAEGIGHFIFGSVGAAERTAGLGITHFEGKAAIERYLATLPLNVTTFRPVTFFENFISARYATTMIEKGIFRFPFPGGRPFQMVALDDLATFVSLALGDPVTYIGRAIEVASDTVTMEGFAEAVGEAIGRPVVFRQLPTIPFAAAMRIVQLLGKQGHFKTGPSITAQVHWSVKSPTGGWDADFNELRALNPNLTDARAWARSIDWDRRRIGPAH